MVTTITDWNDLDDVRNDLSEDYELGNDLDADTAGYDDHASSSANDGKGWNPIGNSDDEFSGSLDGNGHTISDFSIDTSDNYVGLFSYSEGGVIQNIGIENFDVTGSYYTGGLLGENRGTIEQSYATGDVSGSNYTGGLVGENHETIKQSYATGDVSGDGNVGGLVGDNRGTIKQSYATGDVSGDDDTGGLVGYNSKGRIEQSYARGNVSGGDDTGGLVGYNYKTIEESYATGDVSGDDDTGGLVGYNYGTVEQSYWDTETSKQDSSDGGTGLTTSEMQGDSAKDNMSGFDFDTVWAIE